MPTFFLLLSHLVSLCFTFNGTRKAVIAGDVASDLSSAGEKKTGKQDLHVLVAVS